MSSENNSQWLPYVPEGDGVHLPPSIRYLATDNTSLLWYRLPDGTWDKSVDHGLNGAYEQACRLENEGAAERCEDGLVSFLDSLTDIPTLDFMNSQDLLVFPAGRADDITKDQYILADLRLKVQAGQSDPGPSSEGDGADDVQARHALGGKRVGRYVKCTTNLAGILYNKAEGGRDVQLSISSRFSKERSQPIPIWKDWFLSYMIQRGLHVNLLNLDFDNDPDGAWRELLMWVFPAYLQSAMGKGVYRQYVQRGYNDSRPRGRIDVARHIRQNTPFLGTVAYSRRVFDEDNPVTELIRHTVEHIAEQGNIGASILNSSPETVRNVREIRRITSRYNRHERRDVVAVNQRHPVTHALYREYSDLAKLCISILTGRGLNPQSTADSGVHGIIFDCAWLWEEYLNIVMSDSGLTVFHPRNKAGTGKYHLLTRVKRERSNGFREIACGRRVGEIYPDFLIRTESARLVADAKYKPEGNIGGSDYSQVIAYMKRFNATQGLYLHPFVPAEGASDNAIRLTRLRLLDGFEQETRDAWQDNWQLTKIGLNVSRPIPGEEGRPIRYGDYVSCMHAREQALISAIRDSHDLD